MKKKKVMAALVLSAMMIGTLGTSVSASTWKPDGTPGVSTTGGNGSTTGMGVVQHERNEKLFLVAVPTTARQYRFYADPTGNTLENHDKFQFQREVQTWSEKELLLQDAKNDPTEMFAIPQGRKNFSNFVAVYNAGSKDVIVNVDARISVASATNGSTVENDGYLDVQVVSKRLTVDERMNPTANIFAEGSFHNWVVDGSKENQINVTRADALAAGYAVQKGNTTETRTKWEISLPGSSSADVDWLKSEESLTPLGQKVTKDLAVSLEDFNTAQVDEEKLNEFKYPVALFALKGYTDKAEDSFWDKDILARMAVKWYITDGSDEGPSVEDVITISDLKNGNFVPVSLGNGESSMNVVSSVKWIVSADQDPNGVGFTQELLGSQVTYEALTATTGNLVFDQMALTTLNKYESLNGATIKVTFSAPGKNDVEKAFILWVF